MYHFRVHCYRENNQQLCNVMQTIKVNRGPLPPWSWLFSKKHHILTICYNSTFCYFTYNHSTLPINIPLLIKGGHFVKFSSWEVCSWYHLYYRSYKFPCQLLLLNWIRKQQKCYANEKLESERLFCVTKLWGFTSVFPLTVMKHWQRRRLP